MHEPSQLAAPDPRRRAWTNDPDRWLAFLILVVASVLVAGFIVLRTKGLAFFLDDWNFITERGSGLSEVLGPYNDHWQAIPILIYQVGLALRGLDAYPFLVVAAAACHSAASVGLFLALHRIRPWLALVAALALLTFTWSDEVFILPVNTSFTLPVAFGMLALACWDRDVPRRWTDAAGSAAMVAAFASGGMAIPIAVVVTGIAASRRRSVAGLLPPAAPWLVFAAWFLFVGRTSNALGEAAAIDPTLLPAFVAAGLATLAAPLLGLDHRYQLFGLIVVAGVIGLGLGRLRTRSVRIWLPIAGAALVYLVVGVGRLAAFGVEGAEAPRYLFPALALLLLGFAPLVDGLLDTVGAPARRGLSVVVVAWLVVVLIGDTDKFRRAIVTYEGRSEVIATELGAVQRLRPVLEARVDTGTLLNRHLFGRMTVAGYFTALDSLPHEPAPTVESLRRRPEAARQATDAVLDGHLDPGIRPDADPASFGPGVDLAAVLGLIHDATLIAGEGACRIVEVTGADPSIRLLHVDGLRLAIRTDGQRTLQVFTSILASRFGAAVRAIEPEAGHWYGLDLPALSGGLDWSVRLDPPPGSHRFEVCLGAPGP